MMMKKEGSFHVVRYSWDDKLFPRKIGCVASKEDIEDATDQSVKVY